jgi:hypothetical protein
MKSWNRKLDFALTLVEYRTWLTSGDVHIRAQASDVASEVDRTPAAQMRVG